jgi:F-type H+-transporting ATPase subunit gamma
MSSLNEIKTSINNIKGTQKITKAMYLISASKSKKARNRLEKTRYHFNQINAAVAEILTQSENLESVYIGDEYVKDAVKDLYVVLAGDKGQAGGYNHNIIALLEQTVDKELSDIWVAGSMGRSLIMRKNYNVSREFLFPVMDPNPYRSRDIAEMIIQAYHSLEYKSIHLVYTEMVSSMSMVPRSMRLLPLLTDELLATPQTTGAMQGKIVFEPDAVSVFEHIIPHYLKGIIYAALTDAFTSEQYARMFAMDSATKNAGEMISSLSLKYNRARQAKITQEINEIVGGIPAG